MDKIKTIFIGTGEIGTDLLKSLSVDDRFEVILVVTGTDKPAGRKMELQPSPIKKAALEFGLEVFQPDNIKTSEAMENLKAAEPDIMLVMAYGQILSQEVLDIPKIDCLNVHASLLPKYRGASPIQSAILNGEKKTGVSLMKMVKKMDAGPVYQKFEISIDEDETFLSLEQKLSELSAQNIPDAITKIYEGKLESADQNEAETTYVTKINKSDGEINWNEDAKVIERRIRAFNPWPSAYTFYHGKRLKIIRAKAHPKKTDKLIGTVCQDNGISVITADGLLELMAVQAEGKKVQTIKEFLNGNPDLIGASLLS